MMDFKCLTKLISIGRSLSARHCDRGGRGGEGARHRRGESKQLGSEITIRVKESVCASIFVLV